MNYVAPSDNVGVSILTASVATMGPLERAHAVGVYCDHSTQTRCLVEVYTLCGVVDTSVQSLGLQPDNSS